MSQTYQRETDEVFGPGVGFSQDVDHVVQRLLNLRDEIVAHDLLAGVPADLTGHEHLPALGGHTMGEPSCARPVLGMQKLHV